MPAMNARLRRADRYTLRSGDLGVAGADDVSQHHRLTLLGVQLAESRPQI
jgi:hypothetical protein